MSNTKTFAIGWKRSYWPEPQWGSPQSRGAVIRELRRDARAKAEAGRAERVAAALAAD